MARGRPSSPATPPDRPLSGGLWWRWDGRPPWFHVYHAGPDRTAIGRRRYGPIERFDPHTPASRAPAEFYLGDSMRTVAAEAFGAHRLALVCPRYRVAALVPRDDVVSAAPMASALGHDPLHLCFELGLGAELAAVAYGLVLRRRWCAAWCRPGPPVRA